jgi:hypothetical protein
MNHKILYASLTSILVAVGLTNIPYQPANASTGPFIDICKVKPWICEGVTTPWWWIFGCPGCPEGFDLRDILTLPENQSFSVSVQHGPISDTIMIEIPKALSSAMLNNSAVGFDPKPEPPGGPSQNQTVQSN